MSSYCYYCRQRDRAVKTAIDKHWPYLAHPECLVKTMRGFQSGSVTARQAPSLWLAAGGWDRDSLFCIDLSKVLPKGAERSTLHAMKCLDQLIDRLARDWVKSRLTK